MKISILNFFNNVKYSNFLSPKFCCSYYLNYLLSLLWSSDFLFVKTQIVYAWKTQIFNSSKGKVFHSSKAQNFRFSKALLFNCQKLKPFISQKFRFCYPQSFNSIHSILRLFIREMLKFWTGQMLSFSFIESSHCHSLKAQIFICKNLSLFFRAHRWKLKLIVVETQIFHSSKFRFLIFKAQFFSFIKTSDFRE